MTLAVPSTYANCLVRFACAGNSHEQSTALGFFVGGDSMSDVVDAWMAAWTDHMTGGSLSTDYTVTAYVAENVANIAERIVSVDGTSSTPVASCNVSVIAKKSSGVRGRGNRGRMYLPAGYLPENQVDSGGNITSALVGDLNDNLEAVGVDMAAAGYAPVIFHDESSPLAATPTPITDLAVEAMAATQRRRMR